MIMGEGKRQLFFGILRLRFLAHVSEVKKENKQYLLYIFYILKTKVTHS